MRPGRCARKGRHSRAHATCTGPCGALASTQMPGDASRPRLPTFVLSSVMTTGEAPSQHGGFAMRSVRCDVCGTKALVAASKCPRCSNLFEVRDGFGELLPLAYCSSCDSYYPERVGECRWCGTKPEPPPRAPRIWKGVGVGALAALVTTAFLLRDSRPDARRETRVADQRAPAVKSVSPPTALARAIDTIVAPAPRELGNVDSVAPATAAPPDVLPAGSATSPPAPVAITPAPATPPATRATATRRMETTKPRPSTRWVNSVAKSWVVVRAGPSRTSRLVASIGPNSRVQLGETRGTWRRIKARGIAGWVESQSAFAIQSTERPHVLVSR